MSETPPAPLGTPQAPHGGGEIFPNAVQAARAMALPAAGIVVAALAGMMFHKGFLIDRALILLTAPAMGFVYFARPQANLALLRPMPSPAAIGWSLAGFFLALVVSRNWAHWALCLGVLAGLFTLVRPAALLEELRRDGKTGFIAGLAALSGPLLVLGQKYIWMPLAYTTANLMALMLSPFYESAVHIASRADMLSRRGEYAHIARTLKPFGVQFTRKQINFIMVSTDNMYMKIIASMNVGNGLMLVVLMLGIWALVQESSFRKIGALKSYGFSLAFLLLANALWLSLMFLVLPPLSNPPAPSELRKFLSIGNNPLIGWTGYAILSASAVVLLWYYARRQVKR